GSNWASIMPIIANGLVGVGTLLLAIASFKALRRDVQWRERTVRPRLDIRIQLDGHGMPKLAIKNTGDVAIKGTAYVLIEPQTGGSDQTPKSIVGSPDIGAVTEEQFERYWFASLELNLPTNEDPFIYDHPFRIHLQKLCGEQNQEHYVRI